MAKSIKNCEDYIFALESEIVRLRKIIKRQRKQHADFLDNLLAIEKQTIADTFHSLLNSEGGTNEH